MIPKTLHNLGPFEVMSALQKAIRRGHEELAMQMACELLHTSKAFHTMCCNRLEVTAHEDIGVPAVIAFVSTCIDHSKRHYNAEKIGPARLMIASAIRAMCASPKTRSITHFAAAVGLENLNGKVPEIPDWAQDVHTTKGRALGRGLEHFRTEGAQLANPILGDDPYEERAYAQWRRKYGESTADETN